MQKLKESSQLSHLLVSKYPKAWWAAHGSKHTKISHRLEPVHPTSGRGLSWVWTSSRMELGPGARGRRGCGGQGTDCLPPSTWAQSSTPKAALRPNPAGLSLLLPLSLAFGLFPLEISQDRSQCRTLGQWSGHRRSIPFVTSGPDNVCIAREFYSLSCIHHSLPNTCCVCTSLSLNLYRLYYCSLCFVGVLFYLSRIFGEVVLLKTWISRITGLISETSL